MGMGILGLCLSGMMRMTPEAVVRLLHQVVVVAALKIILALWDKADGIEQLIVWRQISKQHPKYPYQ